MLVELDAAGIFRPLGIFQGLPPMTTNNLSHDFHRPVKCWSFFLRSHQWSRDEPPNLLCHRDARCNCKVSNLESEVDGLLQCLRRALKVRLLEGTNKKPAKSLKLWRFFHDIFMLLFLKLQSIHSNFFFDGYGWKYWIIAIEVFFDDGCPSRMLL